MTQPLDPVHTRAPMFSPGSGAPGTEVTVETRDLPALTPVYLGMGATRSSFEVLSQLVTSELGEMSAVVEVPDWATADRTHYFVLVDVYFRPLAVSAAFHVTEPDGTLRRRGAIADDGGDCLTLREAGEGEELYVLTGDVQDLTLSDEVLVEATLGESPGCGQGTVLQVTRTERLD
ncbi:MAG: hypothetical protein OXQ28_12385 [Acidobacteriota bacterium]|nr:hypothetical protein [Acidobacteriota bacterium]